MSKSNFCGFQLTCRAGISIEKEGDCVLQSVAIRSNPQKVPISFMILERIFKIYVTVFFFFFNQYTFELLC